MLDIFQSFESFTGDMGIGALGGFILGYGIKKTVKILAFAFSLGLYALHLLAQKDVITIDYSALQVLISNIMSRTQGDLFSVTNKLMNIPFGTSFVIGFFFGFYNG